MKEKKLVVISHTEHYADNGRIVGWGPTVNEINYLAEHWDEVVHIGCLSNGKAPASSRPYRDGVRFVPIRPFGGKYVWNKLDIFWTLPDVLTKVSSEIAGATHVQLRLPTGIGVYLLPAFSYWFERKFAFWVKYAGNWNEARPPVGYKFQRWWLKNNFARCPVTVNGFWPGQPKHCFSFENPCLSDEDLARGRDARTNKRFAAPFRLIFVGRLEDEKGVSRVIDALSRVETTAVEQIDFIGDGPHRKRYERESAFLGDKVRFHGFADSAAVHEMLSDAHFILLPSTASEGFPKVIAEAACYGCIPVVSDAGSIGHYISNETNGFLWERGSDQQFSDVLRSALRASSGDLEKRAENISRLAEAFTFDSYRIKLKRALSREREADREAYAHM